MAVNRCVLKQLKKEAVVMSCGRFLYAIGPKMEKDLAPYDFVACLGRMRGGLAEERSVGMGL